MKIDEVNNGNLISMIRTDSSKPTYASAFMFFSNSQSNGVDARVDNFRVAKYHYPEPLYVIGEEVTSPLIKADEDEGRYAIEEGIQNILGSVSVYPDQQIYTRDVNDNQKLGTFDKATISGNQRWAFNYRTGNETFTNMTSLGTTVNIWENQSLTYSEIVNQVENFINSTLA